MAVIFVYLLIYSDIIDIDFREILIMMNSFILIFLDILFFIKLKSVMQIFNVQWFFNLRKWFDLLLRN